MRPAIIPMIKRPQRVPVEVSSALKLPVTALKNSAIPERPPKISKIIPTILMIAITTPF